MIFGCSLTRLSNCCCNARLSIDGPLRRLRGFATELLFAGDGKKSQRAPHISGSIAEFVGKRAVENAARRKRLGNLASAAVAEGGPFLPAVIVSERLSPSRVRFAAPESGAPLTASGRSGPVPLWRKGRTAKTPPRGLWIRRPCLESEPGYGKSQWRADLPPSSTP